MTKHEHLEDTGYWTPEISIFSDGCVEVAQGVDLYSTGEKVEVVSDGRVVAELAASIIDSLRPYLITGNAPSHLPRGRKAPSYSAGEQVQL